MFSIFKKRAQQPPDLSGLVTDMHSHLLPGIDDGATDAANSIELINGLRDLGYEKFITTPHILWDIFKNNSSTINPAYVSLQSALAENKMNVEIKYAAEYFLDYHVDDLIEDEIPLFTIKDNMVLVEFSFISAPLDLKDKLFSLQMLGYQPVIAHPERYTYFGKTKELYEQFREAGYLLQVNLLSLTGYYGKLPQEIAQMMVKNKFIDFLGTDLHHVRHLNALQSASALTDTIKLLQDSGTLLNHTL
ncbi:MAG TPA: CpsB/CapC family capsule biosynthesis tyrosine phosphatase [Flavitalea sp.]|nr:CpsB/CapC family capsule biosynthesis tyrosine phosphatase [Flavitalea sp.]